MTDGVLSTIENWTGVRPMTCPWAAFSDPFVQRVIRAYDYFDKGQLAAWEPDASNRLVEGLSFYHRASETVRVKRMRLEREEAEARRKAQAGQHG